LAGHLKRQHDRRRVQQGQAGNIVSTSIIDFVTSEYHVHGNVRFLGEKTISDMAAITHEIEGSYRSELAHCQFDTLQAITALLILMLLLSLQKIFASLTKS
jgi:hypothetical protein